MTTSIVRVGIFLLIALGMAGAMTESTDLERFFSEVERDSMRSGETIKRVYRDENIPASLPLPPQLHGSWNGYLAVVKGFIPSRASRVECANVFLNVSSLVGLQYYSVTEKKWKTLIEQAYTIESPSDPERMADPSVDTLTGSLVSYFYQKDNRSDGLIYRSTITALQDSSLMFTTENVSEASKYLLFKIKKGDACQVIRLFPTQGGYFYIALMRAITPRIMPFAKTFPKSMLNRSDAFLGHYEKALRQ